MASFEFDVDNVLSLMTVREKVAMLAGTKPYSCKLHKAIEEIHSPEPTPRHRLLAHKTSTTSQHPIDQDVRRPQRRERNTLLQQRPSRLHALRNRFGCHF